MTQLRIGHKRLAGAYSITPSGLVTPTGSVSSSILGGGGGTTTISNIDFENGLLNQGGWNYLGPAGKAVVIDDPTGQFGGKVLEINYDGSYSVNRAIEKLQTNVTTRLVWDGYVLCPTPIAAPIFTIRKLLYWHTNPYAYGNPPPVGFPTISAGVGFKGTSTNSLYCWGGYNSQAENQGLLAVPFDTPIHLKFDVNLGSVGLSDGWIDVYVTDMNVAVHRMSNMNFRQDIRDGLGYFQIGEQAQGSPGTNVNEKRYYPGFNMYSIP